MTEEMMRVPLILRGPGVNRSLDSQSLVANIDLAPTIRELYGLAVPETCQGRSLCSLMAGDENAEWRAGLMTEHYGLHEHVWQRAWYCGRWKFVLQGHGFKDLYDLADDPFDCRNLAGDGHYRERRQMMLDGRLVALQRVGDVPVVSGDSEASAG
ncbi:MAG: hypothetical protein CMM46_12645 [Rhodospirillaceae bacterium]|nr:hypothetical protein [Rhodospirillaceae bacterium]